MSRRVFAVVTRFGLCALLACAIVPVAPEAALAARTIRVNADTGSDATGTGTLANPYETIEYAVAQAV